MKSDKSKLGMVATLSSASILSLVASSTAIAQDGTPRGPANPMEEMIVLGRIRSAATDTVMTRMELDVAVDIINEEQISRIGDSTVADALRRLPGATLVDDKFVYIRGLGERYSSTTLNGAAVPSPDLSRSVIPLDIFPTSIVKSLSVQKVFSADMPAAFGGGSVDIQTKGIPDAFLFSVELGTGGNSESADGLEYDGGGDDKWGKDDGTRELSTAIKSGIQRYAGDFNIRNIRDTDGITQAEAEAVNRSYIAELYRDVDIKDSSPGLDKGLKLNVGNVWAWDNGIEFGFLTGGSYETETRSSDIITRDSGSPEEQFTTQTKTVDNVSITGSLALGLRFNEDNSISTTTLALRNTDDTALIRDTYNEDKLFSGGIGVRDREIRYEQREMLVNQIHGEHVLSEDTRDSLNLGFLDFLDGLAFDWYYSDSESTTDLPSEMTYFSNTVVDTSSGEVLSESFGTIDSTGNYRFSDLQDYVDSHGFELAMPFEMGDFTIDISGGSEYWQKSRTYKQLQFYINTSSTPEEYLTGEISEVFSDQAVTDPNRAMAFRISPENEDSYVAANKVYATYGKFDLNWNDVWRLSAGLRWEDYQQVNLPWNPLSFNGSQLVPLPYDDPDLIRDYFEDATFSDDDTFGSVAITYMHPGFWSEDFQLRLSYGETTVRPDLREISPGSFRDPVTDLIVFGNPDVTPALIENIDLRAEWFFSSGDSFTISLFSKDLTNPIEAYERTGGETTTMEIINAESGALSGVEIEFLSSLGELTEVLDPFFIQGNITFLDTEIVSGDRADNPTNEKRPMQGASDTSGNLIFGFDSPDAKHAATLSYNYFSERLFFAGRNRGGDSYEQPFSSLNLTYSFYPIDSVTLKLKAKNLLDENVEIMKEGTDVVTYEKNKGVSWSFDVQYTF